jgi:putative ABC transport system substrate-binding protein
MSTRTRRHLLAATAGLALPGLATPGLARAQGLPRLGVLTTLAESDPDARRRMAALVHGLEALGWRDNRTIRIDFRWGASRPELIARLARELVAEAPDVILANGTPAVAALQPLTRSIPIVCALVTDPVGLGFVESLARPGGNITGFTFIEPSLIAKWLSLLQEVAPGLRRAALLYDPAFNPWYPHALAELAQTAQRPLLEVVPTIIRSAEDALARLPVLAQAPGTGLIIGPGSSILNYMRALAETALAGGMPGVSVYPRFAAEGGLLSYGPDVPDIFRNAAGYVDRILRGASPATLPVQQPVRYEFTINQATAGKLGLAVPPTLLAAADTVIE